MSCTCSVSQSISVSRSCSSVVVSYETTTDDHEPDTELDWLTEQVQLITLEDGFTD